uniref:C-type lectin domain-containing protein n=1 Tax=Rhabditophanes sp. KR3021 TaxID=114890 RepID=A0AC35U862_9BILA
MKFLFFGCLVSYILGSLSASKPCPNEWVYSPHDEKCYKLSTSKSGWNVAEFSCSMSGGHHLSVHSDAHNSFATEMGRRVADYLWLGIAQFRNDGRYVYSDGTNYDFQNWITGRNPPFKRARRCAKINTRTGKWEQSCCKKLAAHICVKDPKVYKDWAKSSDVKAYPSRGVDRHRQEERVEEKKAEEVKAEEKKTVEVKVEERKIEVVTKSSEAGVQLNKDQSEDKQKDSTDSESGLDGFKVIKENQEMKKASDENPILKNPENRERVILTSINNGEEVRPDASTDDKKTTPSTGSFRRSRL